MAFISSSPDTLETREAEREAPSHIITRLDRYFRESVDHPNRQKWLAEAEEAYLFRDGDQLDAKTKAILRKRSQPEVFENRCKVQIDRLMGLHTRQRTRTTFVGRNLPYDEELANMMADLERWVDQQTELEFEEFDTVKDGFTGGMGVLEWGMETNTIGQKQIFGRSENPFFIFPDPLSRRYDWNLDARYVCRAKWMDLENAIEMWPEKEMELRQCIQLDAHSRQLVTGHLDPSFLAVAESYYIDSRRSRLRPVEVWYKRKSKRRVILTKTGVMIDVQALSPKLAQREVDRLGLILKEDLFDEMWVGIFCGGTLIHHDRSPYLHNLFPFVPYWCYRDKSGKPYGWLLNLIPLQKEFNKRRQKALHLLLNQRVKYKKGAIENPGQLAEEMARPDGHLVVKTKMEDLEIDPNTELGQGQLALHQETKAAFDDVSAHSPVDLGQAPGEVRSDRGLARLQQASSVILSELFSNVRRSRRMNARIKFELLKQIIDEDLVIQVVDDANIARSVPISKDRFMTAKERIFDLIVVDTQDFETSRAEQLSLLFQQLPNMLQFGAGWVDFMLELTDLRNKDALRKMLATIRTQPPVQPRVSLSLVWSEMSQIERAGWALALNQQEIAQAVLQGGEQSKQSLMAQVEAMKQASKERMEQLRIQQKDAEVRGSSLQEDRRMEIEALKALGSLQLERRQQDLDQQEGALDRGQERVSDQT